MGLMVQANINGAGWKNHRRVGTTDEALRAIAAITQARADARDHDALADFTGAAKIGELPQVQVQVVTTDTEIPVIEPFWLE